MAAVILIIAAVLAGIFLAGLYGDVVVGWIVFGVVAVLEVAGMLAVNVVRRHRPRLRQFQPRAEGTRATSVEARSQ